MRRKREAVLRHDEIMECKLTTGACDDILRVIAKDVADYDRIHRNVLSDLPGVASMRSIFVLRSIKDWRGCRLGVKILNSGDQPQSP